MVLACQLLHVAPILLRIPGLPQKIFRSQKEYIDFTEVLIEKHRETWNPAYTRDFTDAFLKEMAKVWRDQQNLTVLRQFPYFFKLVDRSWLHLNCSIKTVTNFLRLHSTSYLRNGVFSSPCWALLDYPQRSYNLLFLSPSSTFFSNQCLAALSSACITLQAFKGWIWAWSNSFLSLFSAAHSKRQCSAELRAQGIHYKGIAFTSQDTGIQWYWHDLSTSVIHRPPLVLCSTLPMNSLSAKMDPGQQKCFSVLLWKKVFSLKVSLLLSHSRFHSAG